MDLVDDMLSMFDSDSGSNESGNWLSNDVAGEDGFGLDNFDTDLNLGMDEPWKNTNVLDEIYQQVMMSNPATPAGSDTSGYETFSNQSVAHSSAPGTSYNFPSSGSESEFDASDGGFDTSPVHFPESLMPQILPMPQQQPTVVLRQAVQPQKIQQQQQQMVQIPSNAQVIRIPYNPTGGPIPIVMKKEPQPAVRRPRLCILQKDGKVQTAKVISLAGLTPEQIQAIKSGTLKTLSLSTLGSTTTVVPKKEPEVVPVDDDDEEEDEVEVKHQDFEPLVLTDEERKIMIREKIRLPDRYPLSREEERNLRRIRRKIRNKRSAQDSRQRKKQYVDDLEKRAKICAAEKAALQERLKSLETENASLMSQLKNIQSTMAGLAGKAAPSSTAFLIVLMSVALLMAPSVRKVELEEVVEQQEASSNLGEGLREFDDAKVVVPGRASLADMADLKAAAAAVVAGDVKPNEKFLDMLSGKRKYSWMDIPVSDDEDDDGSQFNVEPVAKRAKVDAARFEDRNKKASLENKILAASFKATNSTKKAPFIAGAKF